MSPYMHAELQSQQSAHFLNNGTLDSSGSCGPDSDQKMAQLHVALNGILVLDKISRGNMVIKLASNLSQCGLVDYRQMQEHYDQKC